MSTPFEPSPDLLDFAEAQIRRSFFEAGRTQTEFVAHMEKHRSALKDMGSRRLAAHLLSTLPDYMFHHC